MADLTARLLDPETFEEALQDPDFCCCIEGMDAIRKLHARLRTAKAEGAAEAYEDIKAQAEDLRKEGGIRASLLRLLTEECVSRAAAIRKSTEAKEGK